MPPTKILIVDDHEMLTDSLVLRLSSVPGLVLLDRYATTDPALVRDIGALRPDVTTVDVEEVGHRTGPFIRSLLEAWPNGQVVVLSASKEPALAVAAARAGAASWVDKTSSIEDLVDVLSGVGQGLAWYPPWHLGHILRALLRDARAGSVGRAPSGDLRG
jgi:two-component system, NarL family, response regulator LiaR